MSWWMYVLLMGLVVAALVLPRKLARRSKLLDRPRPGESERLRKQMEDLLIQLQEVAREVNATLDTKMIALNQLVEEAEQRIRELKDLLARVETAQAQTSPAPQAAVKETPAPPEARRSSQAEETVVRLAGQGKTPLDIARETGLSRGEIDLVLALRRKSSGQ